MQSSIRFTIEGAVAGVRQSVPLAVSVFAYGSVFGMLARQCGMSLTEAGVMSALVYAGSAQLIVLDLWSTPLPVVMLVLTTLMVNLRFLLMGAALHPWVGGLTPGRRYASAFFIADETWALTLRHLKSGGRDLGFLPGSGLLLFAAWVGATVFGYLAGTLVADPSVWGLDFAFAAVFLALLVSLWGGRTDVLPWCIAGGVALIAERCLPGKWYILFGGIAGSLAGALGREP